MYAEKIAKKGHRVVGIDYSKNSIEYAQDESKKNNSQTIFYCCNYLDIEFEDKFDLVILIYLDFCVLKPREREIVLKNIWRALKPGGLFIFDVVNEKSIEEKKLTSSWEMCPNGFWKDEPYLVLNKGYHYPENKVLLNQHIVIDQNGKIDTYLFWTTYYNGDDIVGLIDKFCFKKIKQYDNILPEGDVWNGDNVTFYVAEK